MFIYIIHMTFLPYFCVPSQCYTCLVWVIAHIVYMYMDEKRNGVIGLFNVYVFICAMDQVAERINNEFAGDIKCIFSDDNAEKLILRIRLINTPESKNEHGEAVVQDDEDDSFLKRLETSLLATLSLQGIEGIQRVYMSDKEKRPTTNADGEIVQETQWKLETDGVNLLKVMSEPFVDEKWTTSNDIVEIISVLGIEAGMLRHPLPAL